ncbi:hypothetical protein PISMIDRAFT_26828 [Pisolithus microcarpus 441]|uniref:Uncharacterized protein n=1 Tax=Pisolithus microcarpus 441 TaxID=765257 RepID=A0A0C9ZWG6_9AGAM|nr:hypothetical protein PISMIDRAFT_26828 [Pisolithus microcarpus 441]
MSLAPSSGSRGQLVVQPAYFTSSAFVDPAREDVSQLLQSYAEQYERLRPLQPFTLFKDTWVSQGWTWIHFKIFDARSREAFLKVMMRIFTEHMGVTETPLRRVAALFGLYTFLNAQPSMSMPKLHSVSQVEVTSDLYDAIMCLPDTLNTVLLESLRPHVIYVLSGLVGAFQILPHSKVCPMNPREVPRELVVEELGNESGKRRGRLSKREKKKKAKDSLVSLSKWLDRTRQTHEVGAGPETSGAVTRHVLLSQRPVSTRSNYRRCKSELWAELGKGGAGGSVALRRASDAVVRRMRKMDEVAAAEGLEVGGEGGDRTGLGRVERAAAANETGGGLLSLLEGGGLFSA